MSRKIDALTADNFDKVLEIIKPSDLFEMYPDVGNESTNYDWILETEHLAGKEDDYGEYYKMWCLHKGDLHLGSLTAVEKNDQSMFNLVVDGDLIIDGDMTWYEDNLQVIIYVTGNLKARNIFVGGIVTFIVEGEVTVENGIMGIYGEDGGSASFGKTKAKTIVMFGYFDMYFTGQPEAVVIRGIEADTNAKIDIEDEYASEYILPEYIDDTNINVSSIRTAFEKGKSIFIDGR